MIPPSEITHTKLMIQLLNSTIDEWYTRDDESSDNSQAREINKSLRDYHKELRKTHTEQEQARTEMRLKIEKDMITKLRETAKKQALLEKAIGSPTFLDNTETGKGKKVSESQFAAEQKTYQEQKKQFDAIISCQGRVSTMMETYKVAYGMKAPEKPVVDLFLDM